MFSHRVLKAILPLALPLVQFCSAQYVEDSVDIGGTFIYRLAYNSREKVIYGAGGYAGFFAVACSSNERVASIWLTDAFGVAYDSADNKAYCVYGYPQRLLVLDGQRHAPVDSFTLTAASIPLWVPDHNQLYVSLSDRNRVAVIDCRSDSVTRRIPVGEWPFNLYLNRRHQRLYVVNYDDASVSVIDLDSSCVTATIPVGGYPNNGCYSASANKFYCCGQGITVIDGTADTVVARIALPEYMRPKVAVAVEASNTVLVAATKDFGEELDTVYTLNAASDSIIGRLAVSKSVRAMAWSPLTGLVYCTGKWGNTSTITVLTDDGSRIVRTLAASDGPTAILPVPEFRRVYVAHSNSPWLYVLRDTVSGIADEPGTAAAPVRQQPTIVRGVLRLPPSPFTIRYSLFDMTGRAVMSLRPGPNDVRHLAPGVYFVWAPPIATKVMILD